ncbi:hypothetical protein [Nocardiopsis synnemataformans]|uniref:hypothetical protein n=1 Tax=Nocardiopsis synnemataformans TaxID=61305 RepID=UPI003EB7877F
MDTSHITVDSIWKKAKNNLVPVRVEKIDGNQVHVVDYHPSHTHLNGKYPRVIKATEFRAQPLTRHGKEWLSGYIPYTQPEQR